MHKAKPGDTRKLFIPHSSPVANFIFDEMIRYDDVPFHVVKVLMFFIRHTVGWDKMSEYFSARYIQQELHIGGASYEHALRILCDCWQLFDIERGQGRKKSKVTIRLENFNATAYADHLVATANVHRATCPTYQQLLDEPNTREMIADQYERIRDDRGREDRSVTLPVTLQPVVSPEGGA